LYLIEKNFWTVVFRQNGNTVKDKFCWLFSLNHIETCWT